MECRNWAAVERYYLWHLRVTNDNAGSPWLNLEAGALSKSVDASRVSPFLLGLRPAELTGPLSQFQATLPELEDVVRLLKSINSSSERPTDEARLAEAVSVWWPRLEEQQKRPSKQRHYLSLSPSATRKRWSRSFLKLHVGCRDA
jgi:hypothetical protein